MVIVSSRTPLRAPLLLGKVFEAMRRQPGAENAPVPVAADPHGPVLASVLAGRLAEGDVIPSWPDGTVTRAPSPRSGGRVDVEISGTCADLDAEEYIEILRHYQVAVPGDFVAAAALCYPDGLPGVLGERDALALFGCVDLILRVTYPEMIDLVDLAALIWWECLQDPEGQAAPHRMAYADAARLVAEGPPASL